MNNLEMLKNQQVLFYCAEKAEKLDLSKIEFKDIQTEDANNYKDIGYILKLKSETLTKGYILDIFISNEIIYNVNTFAKIIYMDDKGNYKIVSVPTSLIQGIYKN